jgi:drug/metabolite transporter (DMT)-like permease
VNAGVLYIFSFSVLSAAQAVWVSSILQAENVYTVLFVIFVIVTAIFGTITAFGRKGDIELSGRSGIFLLVLNVATVGIWLFLYISLKYIEPALSATLIYGMNPIMTLGITVLLSDRRAMPSAARLVVAFLTIASMTAVGLTVVSGRSAIADAQTATMVVGLVMTVLTAICFALVNTISKKLYEFRFQQHHIMSMRFFLLIPVTFLLAEDISASLAEHWFAYLLIAVMGNVVPLYLLQTGIKKTEPMQAAYVLLLTPMLVFTFQYFDNRLEFSIFSLASILLVLMFSALGVYVEHRDSVIVRRRAGVAGASD